MIDMAYLCPGRESNPYCHY